MKLFRRKKEPEYILDQGYEHEIKKNALDKYVQKYKVFCYHFGRYVDREPRDEIAKMLYRADIEMTPGMFVSLAGVTAVLASLLVFGSSIFLFYNSTSPLLYIFGLSFLTLVVTAGSFPFVLYNKISNKNTNIEQELPFALGYMSILASAGSTPLEVIRRISIEDYGGISLEFRKVIYRVDLLGEDGISAMNYLIHNTSSEMFRTICIDITNTMQSGGGLKAYLESKSTDLMKMRKLTQKQFVDSLAVYGEGYLSGVVLSVVLVILGIVVASALGIELFLEPKVLFTVFVYGVLPFVNILFLVLLWMKYSGSVV
ncbi:flagellar protein FlaJ [Methanohalophilus levihalophilus]|uniref:type II secretion system F family protein n=1 Tax=Methanohalophilus levihalophilus TaxID=1431282 RepID=UPI001AE70001|nr:type II secretion system F family protein [Methanohalophilus levihalophilus]MBP2029448.1 flagellar protein FlaJ [Methanohalophilus levihalophilus]